MKTAILSIFSVKRTKEVKTSEFRSFILPSFSFKTKTCCSKQSQCEFKLQNDENSASIEMKILAKQESFRGSPTVLIVVKAPFLLVLPMGG